MEKLKRLQQSIDFIEEHLKDDISIKDIAFHSCYSLYHFQRLFTEQTGITVMQYLRKRRLSKASHELCEKDKRIIDLAYDYRFSFEQSFIRSFKNEYNTTPARFKRKKMDLALCKRLSLNNNSQLNSKYNNTPVLYKLCHQKILYGKEYHFYEDENKNESVLIRIKSQFINRYKNQLLQNKSTNSLKLYSFIQYKSAENIEGYYTLAVPAEDVIKIPVDFDKIVLPFHINMETENSLNVNIHSMRYGDIGDIFFSLFNQLSENIHYFHNNRNYSSYTVTDLISLKKNYTPINLILPVIEK